MANVCASHRPHSPTLVVIFYFKSCRRASSVKLELEAALLRLKLELSFKLSPVAAGLEVALWLTKELNLVQPQSTTTLVKL